MPSISKKGNQMPASPIRKLAPFAEAAIKAGKKMDPANIWITKTWVGLGPMGQMKRVKPAPMGRAMTFKRKVCHVTMVVADERAGKRNNHGK